MLLKLHFRLQYYTVYVNLSATCRYFVSVDDLQRLGLGIFCYTNSLLQRIETPGKAPAEVISMNRSSFSAKPLTMYSLSR